MDCLECLALPSRTSSSHIHNSFGKEYKTPCYFYKHVHHLDDYWIFVLIAVCSLCIKPAMLLKPLLVAIILLHIVFMLGFKLDRSPQKLCALSKHLSCMLNPECEPAYTMSFGDNANTTIGPLYQLSLSFFKCFMLFELHFWKRIHSITRPCENG